MLMMKRAVVKFMKCFVPGFIFQKGLLIRYLEHTIKSGFLHS